MTSSFIKEDASDQYDSQTPVAEWLNTIIFQSAIQKWGNRAMFSVFSNVGDERRGTSVGNRT